MAKQSGKFGALAELRHPPQEEARTATAVLAEPPAAAVRGRAGRPYGKRSNPDFEPTNVLLRKRTKKSAVRILEDTEADQDFSELIEDLLSKWISERA